MTDGEKITGPHGFGAVVSIPYGPVAEWLVDAGYTWIVLDAEHAPLDPGSQLALDYRCARRRG